MKRTKRLYAIIYQMLDLYGQLLNNGYKGRKLRTDKMRALCSRCPYQDRNRHECLAAECFKLENWLCRCFIETQPQ